MVRSVVLVLTALLAAGGAFGVDAQKILPADEASKDPALKAVIDALAKACAAKDAAGVTALVSDEAVAGFGAEGVGPAAFVTGYALNDPQSEFWSSCTEVMTQGGAFTGENLYAAPYYFAKWPDEVDPMEHVVAIGPKTLARAEPMESAAVTADVTHQILYFDGFPGDAEEGGVPEWSRVKLPGGKDGKTVTAFVKTAETGSALGYRALFEKTAKGWQLTAFVAGD